MDENRPWLSSYAAGVPAEIEVPAGSLADLLDNAARIYPRGVALDFLGAQTSYAELAALVARAAQALRDQGVGAGDRVALVLPNCPQHVVAFYAALRIGAIVVEHNPLYTKDELRVQLADHDPTVIIAWDNVAAAAQEVAASGTPIIAVDMTKALPRGKRLALRLPLPGVRRMRAAMTTPAPGLPDWDTLVSAAKPLDPAYPRPENGDIALLQYTGGTTGTPKAAMLTHRNLLANVVQARSWYPGLHLGDETFYAILPLFHAYGLTLCLLTGTYVGATIALFPKFDPDMVVDAYRRRPSTFLPGVAPMYPRILEAAKKGGVSLRATRVGLSGAMALPAETAEAWEAATGGMLVEGYGMTESSPILSGSPLNDKRRPGSLGVPFPSTLMRIVEPSDPTMPVPLGEPGEIIAFGPQVFAGYWNNPEATATALTADGWLRTGDIGTMDETGFINLVDRQKELILVGGFNVYPSQVEDVIRDIPGVADVTVVGVPQTQGEIVVAVVVAEPGASLDGEAIRAECREHLAAYKVPKRVVFAEELPRTVIGKVLRRELRDQIADDIRAV